MLYNNIFLTNLDILAVQLLPVKWRSPVHVAFVRLLIFPFKLQLNRLKEERTRNIYILKHNAIVGSVEKVLNDGFDYYARRIRIGTGNRIDNLYLYSAAEAQQTHLPKVVYTQSEIAARNTDFTILIPAALKIASQELETLNYLAKYYTDKDKQYKIEIV